MIVNLSDLQSRIDEIAQDEAKRLGYSLSPAALGVLRSPSIQYRNQTVFDIELPRIREALAQVLKNTPRPGLGSVLGADEVRRGMAATSCHYLWWC